MRRADSRRAERRPKVTVCIAGICQDPDDGRGSLIVCCADRLVSSGVGSAESAFKHHFLTNNWLLSVAWNSDADMQAVVHHVKMKFCELAEEMEKSGEELTIGGAEAAITRAMREWKRSQCDEISGAEWGMTYEQLCQEGKTSFPPELFYETARRIRERVPDVAFIACGFAGGLPLIIEYSYGETKRRDPYSVVGSGEWLAHAWLMQRKYNDLMSLHEATWSIFEAKKHAERERHVGPDTVMCIVRPDGRDFVKPTSLDFLNSEYQRLNAVPPPIIELPPNSLLPRTKG